MRDFPKWINTKKDVENLLSDPRFEKRAKEWLKHQYNSRKAYLPVEEYAVLEKPILKADQRIVVHEDEKGQPVKQVVEQLQVDPNSNWERLGLHEYETIISKEK